MAAGGQQQSGQRYIIRFVMDVRFILCSSMVDLAFWKITYYYRSIFICVFMKLRRLVLFLKIWNQLLQLGGFSPTENMVNQLVGFIKTNIDNQDIGFATLYSLSEAVGKYIRYPIMLIFFGGAGYFISN